MEEWKGGRSPVARREMGRTYGADDGADVILGTC